MAKRTKEEIKKIEQTAKELEDMLLNAGVDGIPVTNGDGVFPKSQGTPSLNYDVVKRETDEKAQDIVDSVILLYLPADFVHSHDYVFQKMEVDKMTVSNLIFQMKTAEHAIRKLLEEIDGGDTQPRMFEVLASLQKSKMEIVKHLAQFMVVMENNYKNLKQDYHSVLAEKKDELPGSQSEFTEVRDEAASSSSVKFKGTKSLMQMVQNYMEEKRNTPNDESSTPTE